MLIIFLKCLICCLNVNNLCSKIDAIYLDNANFCVPLTMNATMYLLISLFEAL